MTLILTHLNKFGIVHASDSNLTNSLGGYAGQGKKVFPIDFLNAGLAIAGSYTVGGVPMDSWMNNFITSCANKGVCSLYKLAEELRTNFNSQMNSEEKKMLVSYTLLVMYNNPICIIQSFTL